jgi:hypothetical protein
MGGKSQPAPDYSAMAAATERGIATADRLGNRQMDFAQRQYDEMKPLAERIYNQQLTAQDQQMRQAQDYYDYQQKTFRPVEQGLVADAQRFNTDAYKEGLARDASAAAGRAFGTTQAMSQRANASMGINPNSGRAMSMSNQSNLGLAAGRANAMTGARNQADQLGFARRMDVTGLGRNLAGASAAAYGGANNSGSVGLNSAMAPGNQYSSAYGQGANYRMGGANMGIQGQANILNSQTSTFNTGQQLESEVFGTMLGGGLTAAMKFSDRRLKENIEVVGRDERTMLPLYEFEYIGGSGKRYLGVMSDDVKTRFPEMVTTMPDGYEAVNYAGLGIEMLEV